jgi:DNA polymerase-1
MTQFKQLPEALKVKSSESAVRALRYFASNKPEYLAVDTETTGLSNINDRAVLLALSDGVRRYCIWPRQMRKFKKLLQDESIILLMANAKYDMWMLANVSIDVWEKTERTNYRVYDVLVMHHLWCDWHPHSLKWIVKRMLGIEMVEFKTLFKLKGKQMVSLEEKLLAEDNEDVVCNYASLDAYVTYHIFWKLKELLKAQDIDLDEHPIWKSALGKEESISHKTSVSLWDYFMLGEVPFTRVLYECERNGLPLSIDAAEKEYERLEEHLISLKRWFAQRWQNEWVNLNSETDMREFFYGKLKYVHKKRTKTGLRSLDKEVLEDWALLYNCDLVRKYRLYKMASKIQSTYISAALRYYRKMPNAVCVHPTLRQFEVDTGRLSSSNPNLQNIPVVARFIYEAPEGFVLAALDYSQVEVIIMAHRANDEALLDAIRNGLDLHAATAALMFGAPYEGIIAAKNKSDRIDEAEFKEEGTNEALSEEERKLLKQRKAAKTITFGLAYGAGAKSLAQDLNITTDEARELMRQYFRRFKGVKEYFDYSIEKAKENGYCTTLMGRRRYLPHYGSMLKGDVSRAERQTKNAPVQGGAADLIRWAMIKIWEDDVILRSGAKLCLQVHDEVVLLVPEEYVGQDWFANHIEEVMAHPLYSDLRCPVRAGMKYGRHFGACK